MDTPILILVIFCLVLVVINIIITILLLAKQKNDSSKALSEKDIKAINEILLNSNSNIVFALETKLSDKINPLMIKIEENLKNIKEQIVLSNSSSASSYANMLEKINKNQLEVIRINEEKTDSLIKNINENIKEFKFAIEEKMLDIKKVTESNLTEIKHNVDEKLDKTLDTRLKQSFENIVNQISSVDKAIGEIKGLANDVGSLKNVLTNVKTKGIVGEVMLSSIIKEILSPEQYEENVVTKKGSSERVEFAVKMPGGNGEYCYLPIDSKFPLESYYKIKEGMENGDALLIEESRKELKNKIKSFAKDISNKYIDAPNTTDFAIMFVPLEGIYVEIIEMGLFEVIQREYKVNIVGPSTFAALLNALQMGFKSYIIQKRSGEVFKLLGAVKTEFEAFAGVLERAQKRVNEANDELDKLVGVRTRKIQSKLKNIASLDEKDASEILEIDKN